MCAHTIYRYVRPVCAQNVGAGCVRTQFIDMCAQYVRRICARMMCEQDVGAGCVRTQFIDMCARYVRRMLAQDVCAHNL